MSRNPQEPWRPPEPPDRPPRQAGGRPRTPAGGNPRSRWMPWIVFGVLALTLLVVFSSGIPGSGSSKAKLSMSELRSAATAGNIGSLTYNPDTGAIEGDFKSGHTVKGAKSFTSVGPRGDFQADDVKLFQLHNVTVKYTTPPSNFWGTILSLAIPILLIIGVFFWMSIVPSREWAP